MNVKLIICIFNWFNLSNCLYFLRFKYCTEKITFSAAGLPKKLYTDIKKNVKQRWKCFLVTFLSIITILVIMMHLSWLVTLNQNYCLEMEIIVFIWVHINWLYVGCYWILCQRDNWVIILSAECTANLHAYFIHHEGSFCSACELGNSVCLEHCQAC